ncbi:serine/threonine protein kinase [Penicillium herquei]|nr:serine/threonine protein kinase [Penicillium herquei]
MAPQITQIADLDFSVEAFDPEADTFLYTSFCRVEEEDSIFFGQIPKRKRFISPEEGSFHAVDDPLPSNIYLKRPRLLVYDDYKEQDAVDIIPALLLEEAKTLEILSKNPHPGIIKGFITALALERHPSDLKGYIKNQKGLLNEEDFMGALESAIKHLHSLGFAHNDINTANVLVDKERMPILADFNSCKPIGEKLTYSQGTLGWTDEDDEWDVSETHHDLFGMEKTRKWLKTSIEVQ